MRLRLEQGLKDLAQSLLNSGKAKFSDQKRSSALEEEELDDLVQRGRGAPNSGGGSSKGSPTAVRHAQRTMQQQQRTVQTTLDITARNAAKKGLDVAWGMAFYGANIAFNTTRNPYFKRAVKQTADFGRKFGGIYTPPHYDVLRSDSVNEGGKKGLMKEVRFSNH
jgi:hypothetical protein